MPASASACASIFRLLLGPGSSLLLPSRSVGPEPAMISAAGWQPSGKGTINVPWTSPVGVDSVAARGNDV
jgi:hypothetical protein